MSFIGLIEDDTVINLKRGRITFNPEFQKERSTMDSSIFPVDKYDAVYEHRERIAKEIGVYMNSHLGNIDMFMTRHKEDPFVKDGHQFITKYLFSTQLAIRIATRLRDVLENGRVVVCAKNIFCLDGIRYICMYNNFIYTKNILFMPFKYNGVVSQDIESYTTKFNIRVTDIDTPLTNKEIKKKVTLLSRIGMLKFIMIDVIIIPDNHYKNSPASFQTTFSLILMYLQLLEEGGTLAFIDTPSSTKWILGFKMFLGQFFEEAYIDKKGELSEDLMLSLHIYKRYRGGIPFDKLYEFNDKLYKNDPTGGFEFMNNKCYIKKIVDYNKHDINDIESIYAENKELVTKQIKKLNAVINLKLAAYANRNNQKYIDNVMKNTRALAIIYAEKNNIEINEWAKVGSDRYFNDYVVNVLQKLDRSLLLKLGRSSVELRKSKHIRIDKYSLLKAVRSSVENAYSTVDKIDEERYKKYELFFNYNQKALSKTLLANGINIMGQKVSRAWIKMYEIINEAKIFDHVDKKARVFFICEAPGNFVNSTLHYCKVNGIELDWTAQSFADGLSHIGDNYGFIKATADKWDFGPKKTGDITDIDNMEYYLKKYDDVDILIGDCGAAWTADSRSNTTLFQLLYAINMPRKGGCFIIKGYVDTDKHVISLLYILSSLYDLYIFKSQRNFWSTELYFIGKDKNNVIGDDIFKKIVNSYVNEDGYMVELIDDKFIEILGDIYAKTMGITMKTKMFFSFLSLNRSKFEENKQKFRDIVMKKNENWLKRYNL